MKLRPMTAALACALALAAQAQAQAPRPQEFVDFGPGRLGAEVTTATSPADEALKETVITALASDQALEGARLSVAVNGGQVLLAGLTRDEPQALHARNVVVAIAGAERVSASITALR